MDIPLKIKELISEKKYSITEFAEKLDVSRNTIYNIFKNKHPVDVDLLKKISIVLQVPITVFFTEENIVINQEETDKKLKALEDQIKALKRKLHIIESTVYSIKAFYENQLVKLDKETMVTIWQDENFQKQNFNIKYGLEAMLAIDKDPDLMEKYRDWLIFQVGGYDHTEQMAIIENLIKNPDQDTGKL
jgi:transcriptional regulator with XRE-family HTH domain